MKKFLILTIVLLLYGVVCDAQIQIFNNIVYLDKFDDVIKEEHIKTLVVQTDSSFIIETKGRKPVEYKIYPINLVGLQIGNEEDIVRLVNDTYGYQTTWCIRDEINGYRLKYDDFCPTITLRVVSKYSTFFEFKRYLFWIEVFNNEFGNNISRVVYFKTDD